MKELEDNADKEKKQRAFEIMFSADQPAEQEGDRINSACSTKITVTTDSDNSTENGNSQINTIQDRKVKVERTKFLLQDIIGQFVIPVTTVALLFLYLIVVIMQC